MMAAIRAGNLRQDVTLIEKNPIPGKKLLLSGKGRCNLTNACELELFLKRFSKNGQFLRDAFKKFFNQDLIKFFKERGLEMKIERQLRVFPATEKSASILEVLEKELRKNKVKVLCKSRMKDIIIRQAQVKGILLSDSRPIPCDRLILATGGASYSFTGSDAGGLSIARRLGHTVIALRPGLVPLETSQRNLPQGLTLRNIRIKFTDGKKQLVSEIGELLFTDSGISGPLVLTLSGHVSDWLSAGKRVCARIDLKPALSEEQLDARLLREFKVNPKKAVKNALKSLLPVRLVGLFLKNARIDPEKKTSHVTQEERRNLIALFKSFSLDIIKTRPLEEAMVTRGGVSLKEVDPRTMESRIIKGLYFAGEMLDVDADTGGFNLQAAFSTGYLAGESAALS